MHLKKITLINFRCFTKLEINLHPRLTVLVGVNGAGKTAVLDGIATALSPVLTHLSSAHQRLTGRGIKDTDFRIESLAGRGGKERWGIADYSQVVAETPDGLTWDYWRPSSSNKEPLEKHGGKQLKEYMQSILESYRTATPALTPVFAYYGARRGYIDVPERLRGAKENYAHPTSALIGALNSLSDFREMLAWFDQEESSELRANKGLPSSNFAHSKALTAVRAAVVSLLGGAFKNPHFNSAHKFVLEREDGGAPMLASQLSQGYQSMLALAMDFSRRLAIANSHLVGDDAHVSNGSEDAGQQLDLLGSDSDPAVELHASPPSAMSAPAIMLVDEIDLHLHPVWQQRVLLDLMRTFPKTQFIVTTHSPQVLTSVKAECVRGLKWEKDKFVVKDDYQFSEGAEAQLALEDILGAPPRPENLAVVKKLKAYLELIENDQWDSPTAAKLRTELDEWGRGHESALLKADMDIRMRQFRRDKAIG
ncbi:MAG: AAA family ATPase [Hylemonella sp.]|nr:AAA family ATPase [Hylemonella sp.]